MDCDTTGVEPDFALVKFKKLAGGGYFRIINQSVPGALARLGYTPEQCRGDRRLLRRHRPPRGRAATSTARRSPRTGFPAELARPHRRGAAVGVRHHLRLQPLRARRRVLPRRARLQRDAARRPDVRPSSKASASPRAQIEEANDHILGRMTIEGAPHLREEHYAVFDCANRCGKYGTRFIAPMAHVRSWPPRSRSSPAPSARRSTCPTTPPSRTSRDGLHDRRRPRW